MPWVLPLFHLFISITTLLFWHLRQILLLLYASHSPPPTLVPHNPNSPLRVWQSFSKLCQVPHEKCAKLSSQQHRQNKFNGTPTPPPPEHQDLDYRSIYLISLLSWSSAAKARGQVIQSLYQEMEKVSDKNPPVESSSCQTSQTDFYSALGPSSYVKPTPGRKKEKYKPY